MANLFEHLSDLIVNNIDPADREAEIFARYGRQVSIMILDSSGFSRISEKYGIVYFLTRLVMMRRIVEPILDAYNNIDFKFEADNIYGVFEHPDDAIRVALDAHAAVRENKLMLTESEPFRVCAGIGYGNLLYSETMEGYFGEELTLASKLGEDTADGGETLLTTSAYESADRELVKSFTQASLSISGIEVTYYQHQFEN
jgi:class 3 adenylate cyclase